MKQVVTVKGSLKIEERNLLSVAYKNVVGSRRSSWRVLSSLLEKSEDNSDYIEEYKKKIEDELNDICTIVIVSIIINYGNTDFFTNFLFHLFRNCWTMS